MMLPQVSVESVDEEDLTVSINDLLSVRYALAAKFPQYNPEKASATSATAPKKVARQNASFMENVCKIEIMWNNQVQPVYFSKPKICEYLSDGTKEKFMEQCDYDTCDNRVSYLMDHFEKLIDEMEVFCHLSKSFPAFKYMLEFETEVRTGLFVIAFLLNLHVIMTVVDHGVYREYDPFHAVKDQIRVVLGLLCLLGYAVFFVYRVSFTLPMIRRGLNRAINKELNNGTQRTYKWKALIYPLAATAVLFAVFAVHYIDLHHRTSPAYLFIGYAVVYVLLVVPHLLFCIREVIGLPNEKSLVEYSYFLVLDLLWDQNVLREEFFVAVTLCGLGYHYCFFTLLLLDFVMISEDALNTVRSVTKPWRALVSLVFLYLIVMSIFGVFGYVYFTPQAFAGADAVDRQCTTMIDCLSLVLYNGIIDSSLGAALASIYPGTSDGAGNTYTSRFFFDLAFYICVGALLVNMVTGVIVDTFSSLRDETEQRRKGLESQSFVSGLSQEDLENTPLGPRDLDQREHSVWGYVYYICFIRAKDSNDHNGIESYVSACIAEDDEGWFPRHTCCALAVKSS
jgi:hypothetical protein